MIHALVLAAVAAMPPCWNVFDAALRHNASAPHPQYVVYSERMAVSADGAPVYASMATVDYRDDGLARVSDERFDYQPFLTRRSEPGPPELGPYAGRREMWLPDPDDLKVIADVHAGGKIACTIADEETYKSHDTYRLVFTGAPAGRPTLEQLWIDTSTHDIWKLIVTGPVTFWDDPSGRPGLAEFQVELGYSGRYLVVNHVVWKYNRHQFSQYVDYFGEYTYSGYSFPSSLPASVFADEAAAVL